MPAATPNAENEEPARSGGSGDDARCLGIFSLSQEHQHVLCSPAGNLWIAGALAEGHAAGDRPDGGFEIFRRPGAQPDGGQVRAGRWFAQLPDIACQAGWYCLCDGDEVRSGSIRFAPVLDQPDAVRELDLPEPHAPRLSTGWCEKPLKSAAVSPSASEAAVAKASVTLPEIRWIA